MSSRSTFAQNHVAYLLAAPQVLLCLAFFYWPAAHSLVWSLRLEHPFGGPAPFVGLENFRLLFSDRLFLESLLSTLLFSGATTLLSLGLALAAAVAVDRALPGAGVVKTVVLWPYAIAAPAAGILFQLMADPHIGLAAVLNDRWPGLWNPAASGIEAITMVIAAFVWLHAPFNFIFLLAGLGQSSRPVLEAAALDGAGPWRQFLHFRMPMLRPYLFFLVLLDIGESFTQSFGIIDATTRGGPGGATNILIYNIYADAFLNLDFSRASAESVLLMLVMAAVFVTQFRWITPEGRR